MKWIYVLIVALLILSCVPASAEIFQNSTGQSIPVACDKSFAFSAITTATQEVATATGKKIYVCGVTAFGTAAVSVITLQTGTGSNCGTANATVLSLASAPISQSASLGSGMGLVIAPIANGSNLCIQASASATGAVTYAQF